MAHYVNVETPPRSARLRLLVPALVAVVVLAAIGVVFVLRDGAKITIAGLAEQAVLGKTQLAELRIRVTAQGVDVKKLRAEIDGVPVRLTRDGAGYVLAPPSLPSLADGAHTLRLVSGETVATRQFTVDTTAPVLAVTVPTSGVRLNRPVTVTGTVESGAQVAADPGTVKVDGDKFSVEYPTPPNTARLTATDKAGNTTTKTFRVPVTYPAQVRALHLSGYAWAHEPFRKSALKMLKEKRINAIQLDVKEEDGIVNFDLDVPLAKQAKAIVKKYDVAEAVRTIHDAGARVIGRVVAFRDPVLAEWAWKHGRRDWTVQAPGGGPYNSKYGDAEFTNFAHPAVRQYNVDIAVAAVKAGFDDIVFDYIRRPDGPPSSMRFPGLRGSAERSIANFCAEARDRLHAAGGYVGAAVYAQAVLHPEDTAQDPVMMATNLDVIVPMDYPNHWSEGSYGVANPAADTYPIVHRSMKDWADTIRGTGCALVPWLWASDLLGGFSVRQAAEEIRGARNAGLQGWFMWNAESHYDKWREAFSPDAQPVR